MPPVTGTVVLQNHSGGEGSGSGCDILASGPSTSSELAGWQRPPAVISVDGELEGAGSFCPPLNSPV